jgi:hypothetical protein
MPRALWEPAACARGKRRVLLETSAHSLPSLDSRLFPRGFFRGLYHTFGIRACGSAASEAHTGASPPPPPLSPAVAVAVRRWARGAAWPWGFDLENFDAGTGHGTV